MDPERERIQADLRGLIDGEARCDDVFLQMYASDASIYEIKPLCVVRPRGLADVVACVKYAAENDLPVHPRGAGTGVSGESLGPGLVLDFSHSMRRVVDLGEETVRVQPGVVHAQLNRYLAPHGRIFGPDPATRSVTTMGSVLALDASGSHWPRYGSARRHVVSMQVVLADGTVTEVSSHEILPERPLPEDPRRERLVRDVADVIERNREVIDANRPRTLVNRCGYQLHDVLADGSLDLARVLVGSEGTLALITEATVRTEPRPEHRGVALLFFDRLESAAQGAILVAGMGVSACDLMDRRLLSIARESDVRFELLIPSAAEAMLLVEYQADDVKQLSEKLRNLVNRLQRRKRLAFDSRTTMERDERDLFWRMTRRVIPLLYRLEGSTRALPFVEDIAVPPDVLPTFLVDLQNTFKAHQVTASVFSHAGHGQLHVRPFLDMADPQDVGRMESLAKDLYEQVIGVGGTISGEHGLGLSRTWYLRQQSGELYDVFSQIKDAFDPRHILNRGKVIAGRPQSVSENLRPVAVARVVVGPSEEEEDRPPEDSGRTSSWPIPLRLAWPDDDIAFVTRSCNGCGRCRTLSPDERMCPIFRFAPREEASPRAKANLMRAVLTGRLDPGELTGETLKEVADLCVNCHQCRVECPAGVDVPKLMVECKAQYVATNGLSLSDWFLTRLDLFSGLACRIGPAANWALRNRFMRWLLEKTVGVAQGRKLPRFAGRSFLRRMPRRRRHRPTRGSEAKVLYFVDVFANWHDVQLADALIRVMEHNGIAVYVPPGQLQAGMAMISVGAVDAARKLAKRNVKLLADAVRQGYQVVTTEPAAAMCLTHEYLNLLDDDDARLVARNSSDACLYLWKMHQAGRLELDLKPVNASIGYHQPCMIRAMRVGMPGKNLLSLIPGLKVHSLEHGCSGMAGMFGVKRENYRSSLRAGWQLISAIRREPIQAGATECSTCKMQMEQGTDKPTLHPLKLLALSYGLMPEVAGQLTEPGEELVTT